MSPPNIEAQADRLQIEPVSALKAAVMTGAPTNHAPSSNLSWASYDPQATGLTEVYHVSNLVNGQWVSAAKSMEIPNPIDKHAPSIFTIPDTQVSELEPFFESLRKVSKSGLHNPFKNPDRYVKLGEVTRKAGDLLSQPDVAEFFARSIMKCVPKSHGQAMGEVRLLCCVFSFFCATT